MIVNDHDRCIIITQYAGLGNNNQRLQYIVLLGVGHNTTRALLKHLHHCLVERTVLVVLLADYVHQEALL